MNEDEQLKKRFLELADKSYKRDICLFTNFLSLNEFDLFLQMEHELSYAKTDSFGGASYCERRIVRFGSLNAPYPIHCVHISPLQKKFADELSHRDFLGALMNLGVKRETLGDIIVTGKEAYVFCISSMSEYIIENLHTIKHTSVKCALSDDIPETSFYNLQERILNLPSPRLDAVISEVYHMSRNQSQLVMREKKVFVNGRLNENNSYLVKSDDIITVRGMGKFIFDECLGITKKGRERAKVRVFI